MSDYEDLIMPETEGPVLCYLGTRPVSVDLYNDFIGRVEECIQNYGEFRLLIYYKNFLGWDKSAAEQDVVFFTKYGKHLTKLCMVNAPEKEIMEKMLRKNMIAGEIKIFSEMHLAEAITWIKA